MYHDFCGIDFGTTNSAVSVLFAQKDSELIKFDNNSSNPIYYAKALYLNGKPLARLVIPEGISEISPFAFTNCRTLVSVTVPDTVTAIGKDAFYG
jgi:molecular chaperone DnaK (HSP70)